RPPDSGAPPAQYPRVCVLRDLLGPKPKEPVRVITEMNWSILEIEASPDGTYFLVDGLGGPGRSALKRCLRAYRTDGTLLIELPAHRPVGEGSARFPFDPTGRLLVDQINPYPIHRLVLLEMPSGRLLG